MISKPRCVVLLTICFGLGLGTPTSAQGCTGLGTFWKRDNLPVVPGLTAVGVVAGLCEGESAGVVFEMPANMPPQRLKEVVAPWGEGTLGIPGFVAQLDLEVYDGVSFTGGIPSMGTPVFQLSSTGSAMQVQSHALNTLDVSGYDIIVGLAPPNGTPPVRRFAVCFRVDINAHPTGSCAGGYNANFFTDAQTTFGGCSSPVRTNLIEIQGQGWRDAALAQFTGLPLAICPVAYNGNWCIRCCTEDAFPATYATFAPGCPSSLGVSQLIPATLPRIGTNMLVIVNNLPANLALMLMGFTNGPPFPVDMTFLGMDTCLLRVSLEFSYAVAGGGGTAVHTLVLPLDYSLLGLVLHQQAFVFAPGWNAFGGVLSDASTLQIGL